MFYVIHRKFSVTYAQAFGKYYYEFESYKDQLQMSNGFFFLYP